MMCLFFLFLTREKIHFLKIWKSDCRVKKSIYAFRRMRKKEQNAGNTNTKICLTNSSCRTHCHALPSQTVFTTQATQKEIPTLRQTKKKRQKTVYWFFSIVRGPPPLPLHNKRRDVGAGAVGSKSAHRCNFVIVSTPLTLQLRAAIHPPKLGESPEETKWMTGFALFRFFSIVREYITNPTFVCWYFQAF